jgi:hypothetical protein
MADSSSANTNSSASQVETVRSSSQSPTSIYRSWARDRASGASKTALHRLSLLNALSKFVHANGGFVVSPPGEKVVRIEVPRGSDLPVRLAAYHPVACGCTTRVTYGDIAQMDVIEIVLEGAKLVKIAIE